MSAALLLLGCSLSHFGMGVLDRAADRWGYHAELVETADARLRYLDNGRPNDDREVVVLLHGFGGDGVGTWRAQLRALGDPYRVLVPDLLWFGDSAGGTPTLSAQADAVAALLDDAGADAAAVVGISYGGFVALELAARAPARVGPLVIVASPGPFYTEEDQAAFLERVGAGTVEEVLLPGDDTAVHRLLALTSTTPRRLPGFLLRDIRRGLFAEHQVEQTALLADLRSRRSTAAAALPALHPPPLLVWGEEDPIFPVHTGRALARALGGELVVLPATAHAPIQERAALVNALLLDYLATARVSN